MPDKHSLDSLFTLFHTLKRSMQEQIEALNLEICPMNVRVLKIIANQPQCTAIDIANFLERDKAQVTRLLNSLTEKGLIVKKSNPEDKRSQCLCITENGQQVMKKIAEIDAWMVQKITKDLSKEQLEELQLILSQMIKNLAASAG